jgi:small subunit ribosomal protein S13
MRLLGVTIPDKKKIEIGLTTLYGVGRVEATRILELAGIDGNKIPSEIDDKKEGKLRDIVAQIKLEGELKREIASNIKRLKDLQSYRGIRHARKLPARGQRTRTNSRTIRGNVRKTMGSGKKKLEKK